MSSYLSNLIVVGNLGRDPEMRYAPSGKPVTSFSLAVNRQYNTADGQTCKEVVWFRISAWGKQAEACNQYLARGAKVLVEGRLDYDPTTGGPKLWEGQDGLLRTGFELTAVSVRFLSKAAAPAGANPAPAEEPDIPF